MGWYAYDLAPWLGIAELIVVAIAAVVLIQRRRLA
jgi:hypothetical protein